MLRFLLRQLKGWWYYLSWKEGKHRRGLRVRRERLNLVSNINFGAQTVVSMCMEIGKWSSEDADLMAFTIWHRNGKMFLSCASTLKYCSIFLECWVGKELEGQIHGRKKKKCVHCLVRSGKHIERSGNRSIFVAFIYPVLDGNWCHGLYAIIYNMHTE